MLDPTAHDPIGRGASAVKSMPVSRAPIFDASCAERFADGYAAWSLEETAPLPSPGLVRKAINACWSDSIDTALITELSAQIDRAAPSDGQPLFSSKLSIYVVEISLLQEALASKLEPDRSRALPCSEFGAGFLPAVGDLRRELAGIGPDHSDPGREVREFEEDPEAIAECEHQLADTSALQSESHEVGALREPSSAHGRRVLRAVMNLVDAHHGP